jgi:hypothetical protein
MDAESIPGAYIHYDYRFLSGEACMQLLGTHA